MGFPVVTVSRQYGSGGKATLRQDRFLISKSPDNPDKHDYMWWIPITFASPGGDFDNTKNAIWMSEEEKTKEIVNMPDDSTPVIFNVQETGYYRYALKTFYHFALKNDQISSKRNCNKKWTTGHD